MYTFLCPHSLLLLHIDASPCNCPRIPAAAQLTFLVQAELCPPAPTTREQNYLYKTQTLLFPCSKMLCGSQFLQLQITHLVWPVPAGFPI